ncbi:hypothetical protein NEILACOT_05379 [Neisseria lactamica ATCC 23970]|uniref:Uncharacterized protein n=1 Tax=Neisseria lactamica ATCC 23970 TaxID=546265 RepID=D0WCU5_NEILA|nr:hypothetical protein NEILACOT_05379 [Neisseria lactamica ATCC 23970]KFJ34069.1 hypothetical protein DR91_2071 [Neisseria lactamica ATCC 23970]
MIQNRQAKKTASELHPKMRHLTDFRRFSFLWQNIQMNSDLPSSNTIWQGTAAQEQQTIFLFPIHWYADG